MADLLLELFSEEIPARMQAQAAKDLERLVIGALSDRGLLFEAAKAFSGPRRLTLAINGLPAKQSDVSEEKKGPRINAPEKAIEGFLRSAGVTLDQCEKRDDGKGEFYVAVISRKGRDTAEVLAEVLPETFAKLPWPKSMRFPGSPVRWVRPLHGIVCTLDGEVVPFEFAGVKSGDVTYGHRFLSQGPIEVRRFEDYEKKLEDAYVILDAARRKQIIWEDAKNQAFVHNLEPIADEGLLEEVSGLAEWPVVLTGKIEDQFMDVPAEILQTSMRTHQKYFSTKDSTGKLANRFIVVANMVTQDAGKEIIAGNERVLRARLSDAKFFWDQDRQTKLADRVEALKGIVFHAKLGTQYERVERIEALATTISPLLDSDPKYKLLSQRAAQLCKADLTTGVVGEFPELQGVMGRYYAMHDGEYQEVSDAIRDHYRPQGPSDSVPKSPASISVALADKFDSLVSLWAVGEKPTGSKDPFALRRSCLGIIRILLDNTIRLRVTQIIHAAASSQKFNRTLLGRGLNYDAPVESTQLLDSNEEGSVLPVAALTEDVWQFFVDRLKVVLRDQGIKHDTIDAVVSVRNWRPHDVYDDIVMILNRTCALQTFLDTDSGKNLLIAYRRSANILKTAERSDGGYGIEPDKSKFEAEEEHGLGTSLDLSLLNLEAFVRKQDFTGMMTTLSKLRSPVDVFFDKVTVNVAEPELRQNRLLLLSRLRATMHLVADFSKIEG